MKETDYDNALTDDWHSDKSEEIDALDRFLFEDLNNNWLRGNDQDRWEFSWSGYNFLVYDNDTKRVTNIMIIMAPGDLSEERIKKLAKDQEWEVE